MRTYLWEFTGGHGEGTAKQFRLHLDDFLKSERIEGCQTGVISLGPAVFAAFCKAPHAAQPAIEGALRPPRYSDD